MTGIIGRLRRACVGVCLLAVASGAARGAEMAFVEVGDPGNTANIVSGYPAGGVSGMYKIGTYEVTNAQYVEFLNAVDPDLLNHYNLYNPLMKTDDRVGGINIVTFVSPDSVQTKYAVKAGRGNLPVTYVSFYDALRFINWMNNGKGNANTEAGAYTLKGTQPTPDQQNDIVRNAGATYFMPNDDEWYKAAYYKGGGTDAGYWKYATSSDTMPKSETPGYKGSPNSANYFNNGNDFADGYNNGYALTRSATLQDNLLYLSDVGGYTGSVGPYGTFDQNGNAYEWDETLSVTLRSIRGVGLTRFIRRCRRVITGRRWTRRRIILTSGFGWGRCRSRWACWRRGALW